ncbi:Uncharacterised protein [Arthrobacter agilis]|nr:Uncharacterised protein [Arthrobacter agilis]
MLRPETQRPTLDSLIPVRCYLVLTKINQPRLFIDMRGLVPVLNFSLRQVNNPMTALLRPRLPAAGVRIPRIESETTTRHEVSGDVAEGPG